jgi:hypothetical protein
VKDHGTRDGMLVAATMYADKIHGGEHADINPRLPESTKTCKIVDVEPNKETATRGL